MHDVVKSLARALACYHHDEQGCHLTSGIHNLPLQLQLDADAPTELEKQLRPFLQKINDDLWNLSTLAERLEFTRKLAIENEPLTERWFYYAKLDVDHFHTDYRAILDFVTQIIAHCSGMSGQLPTSFRKLLQRKQKYCDRIPPPLFAVLEDVDWFWEIRKVRDSLIHAGATTLIFMKPVDGILFQVYSGKRAGLVTKPYLLFNENVAYFDRYAAVYFSYLLMFLEDLAQAIISHFKLKSISADVRNYSPGYVVLEHWTKNLLLLLQERGTEERPCE